MERKRDFCVVSRLVQFLTLLAQHDVSIIEIPQIIILFDVCHEQVSAIWIGRSESDEALVQSLERAQIVRRKDKLPFPFFRDDPKNLTKQIFEYP